LNILSPEIRLFFFSHLHPQRSWTEPQLLSPRSKIPVDLVLFLLFTFMPITHRRPIFTRRSQRRFPADIFGPIAKKNDFLSSLSVVIGCRVRATAEALDWLYANASPLNGVAGRERRRCSDTKKAA
jgi:hypothetical protein